MTPGMNCYAFTMCNNWPVRLKETLAAELELGLRNFLRVYVYERNFLISSNSLTSYCCNSYSNSCLCVCACTCVNIFEDKSLMLTAVAFHCSEIYAEKAKPTPIFLCQKYLHLNITTLKIQRQNYMSAAKVGVGNLCCQLCQVRSLKYTCNSTATTSSQGRTPESSNKQLTWMFKVIIPHEWGKQCF